MNRQLDHMVRLIDDLLDVSRISRGVLELKKERVDLAQLVHSAVESTSVFFERRKQTVEVDAAKSVHADVDPTRVVQILGNLLHNASKFTPEGKHIQVSLVREGNDAYVRVVDSGVGIPANQLERVFEMFAQVERFGPKPQQGLGIGLSLARRLADMHGGTLVATSAGEARGATFTLVLPAPARAGETETPDGAARGVRGGSKLKILVVEDNDDIADTLADLLGSLGHRVAVARSGPEGVALVQDVQPDIVLCDLGLPGMDGLEVCRAVRKLELRAQPIMIALTGWGRDDDRRRTSDAGFDHHLVKPIAAEKLSDVLRRAVEA
jgi:CheY-like chemotaxis protein